MSNTGLKASLVRLKNNSLFASALWIEYLRLRGLVNLALYDDVSAIRKLYHDYSDRYPDLESPRRFSEKLQWIKLNERNPLMTVCADKFAVRQWLADRGYGELLNDLIGVYDRVEDIDLASLPRQFVLKAAHSSGWNIICREKSRLPWFQARLLLKAWLRQNIFWNGREWPYKGMPHRIVCEAYLEDTSGSLRDYKFYCFNGEPRFAQANSGRGAREHIQNFYDLGWKPLPFGKDIAPTTDRQVPAPENLQRLISIARDLAAPFSYVRVDFYEVEGRPIFGEMTFFPASGLPDFIPDEYDMVCGDMLSLPHDEPPAPRRGPYGD